MIAIDCHGHEAHESVSIEFEGEHFDFVFADRKEPEDAYALALFVDYWATMNRRYLLYPKSRRIAVLGEPNASTAFVERPALARRFTAVMTHDARLLERGAPYVEFPFGTSFVEQLVDEPERTFDKTRLVSMIGGLHPEAKAGGHALRNEVFRALVDRDEVDCFGKGVQWIDSKLEGLADYGFSIAMENCARDFYFTEKIIDCLLTDTVPIYWGCPGIERYFDARGLLRFKTVAELEEILAGLSWERYREMLPFVRANRDKALAQGWATRRQGYERLAKWIAENFSPTLKPSRLAAASRRLERRWRVLTRPANSGLAADRQG